MRAPGDRRADLAARVADALLAHGLAQATLRPLAQAAGTSDRMLLYYFRDKDDLLTAAMAEIAVRMQGLLAAAAPGPLPAAALTAQILALTEAPEVRPFLALWLDMAGRAAHGEVFWEATGRQIGQGLLDWIAARLVVPDGDDARRVARDLLARVEGDVVLRAFRL